MLALLNWEVHKHELPDVMKRLTFVEQSEIMKFLPETFEAIFNILHQSDSVQTTLLVYAHVVYSSHPTVLSDL